MKKSSTFSNAAWIIFCRIIQAILSLFVGMWTARYLGPSNYGLINYASSLAAFVAPIAYLGINEVLVLDNYGLILGDQIFCLCDIGGHICPTLDTGT